MTDSNGSRTLFQTLRVPFDMKAVALAFLGLIVLWVGGSLILDTVFENLAESRAMSQWDEKHEKPDGEEDAKKWQQKRDEHEGLVEKKTEINSIPCMVTTSLEKMKLPIEKMPVIGGEVASVIEKLYGPDTYEVAYELDEGETKGLGWIGYLVTLVWWFLVLAVFGGAICRIAACRIARDEGVGIRDALRFSMKNILSYLLAPVAVALVIAFLWGCILLAGAVASIPFAGPILNLILYPLVILSGLIMTIVGFVGLLGLLMMVSAVSTERNGALDAISRAFSYIFSRPVQFFFAYFLIFLFAYVIFLVGGAFGDVVTTSFETGVWAEDLAAAVQKNTQFGAHTPDLDGQGFYALAGFWVWLLHRILWWGIAGYALYYILGGTTSVYFSLRRDVDGTEESELYLEDGDEDEFDFSVTDTPAAETPAAETPAAETPAPETPAAETPAAETPEPEAPAPETPAPETPAPEAPTEDTLVIPKEESATEEAPATKESADGGEDEEQKTEGGGDA